MGGSGEFHAGDGLTDVQERRHHALHLTPAGDERLSRSAGWLRNTATMSWPPGR